MIAPADGLTLERGIRRVDEFRIRRGAVKAEPGGHRAKLSQAPLTAPMGPHHVGAVADATPTRIGRFVRRRSAHRCRTCTRSRCMLPLLLGEEAVGRGEFTRCECPVLVLPRLHGAQALFDTERSFSGLIQPRRKAHAMARRCVGRGLCGVLFECHGDLSDRHGPMVAPDSYRTTVAQSVHDRSLLSSRPICLVVSK